MSLLEVRRLTLRFGGLVAVSDVSFAVERGQIVSVIGPNGAGKTSVFNAITGVYQPSSGEIFLDGKLTCRTFTGGAALGLVAAAAVTGLGAALAFNLEPLWQAIISDNYTYQSAFPWAKAVRSGFDYFVNLSAAWSIGPFLIGAAIGALGGFSVWQRATRTPDVVSKCGIARTFQNIRLFSQMSVLENILVGMDSRRHTRFWHAALRLPLYWREHHESRKIALELLEFVGLKEVANERACNLPYGSQRRLEIARALATAPSIVLLDEPAAGMNPSETDDLMELIRKIRDRGVTVLLIEHHMDLVMGISDHVVVLDYGHKIAEGPPEAVRRDPRVIEAYLGKEDAA